MSAESPACVSPWSGYLNVPDGLGEGNRYTAVNVGDRHRINIGTEEGVRVADVDPIAVIVVVVPHDAVVRNERLVSGGETAADVVAELILGIRTWAEPGTGERQMIEPAGR